jgi:hypothetical protein
MAVDIAMSSTLLLLSMLCMLRLLLLLPPLMQSALWNWCQPGCRKPVVMVMMMVCHCSTHTCCIGNA